jgi:D-alanyl-D-alanine carboxypeptidase
MPVVGSHTRTTSVGGPAHLALTRAIAVAVAGALFVGCGGGDGRSVAATGTESESILADGASAAEENPEARDAVRDDSAVVHPSFTLTASQLNDLVAGESPATREAIAARPEVFLDLAGRLLSLQDPLLAVVDKETALPAGYEPEDLVPLSRYSDRFILNREGLSLRAVIIPDLIAMVEAARLDGVLLDISSTYRSYTYQENLFAYWVDQLGREEAERVSARAGTSQHQLGTTVDFGSVTTAFAAEPGGIWLSEHAHRFGFSLSYPDGYEAVTGYAWEPWHFRWLSRPALRMEQEFFSGIQQHFLEFWREAETPLRNACTTCS